MRKRILALFLMSVLLAGCGGKKININPNTLEYLRGAANRTKVIYLPEILNGLDVLRSQPGLDQAAIDRLDHAKKVAEKARDNIEPLARFIIALVEFDPANKEQAAKLLHDARAAWGELTPLLAEINARLAALVTDNPILRAAITSTPLLVDGFLGAVEIRLQ